MINNSNSARYALEILSVFILHLFFIPRLWNCIAASGHPVLLPLPLQPNRLVLLIIPALTFWLMQTLLNFWEKHINSRSFLFWGGGGRKFNKLQLYLRNAQETINYQCSGQIKYYFPPRLEYLFLIKNVTPLLKKALFFFAHFIFCFHPLLPYAFSFPTFYSPFLWWTPNRYIILKNSYNVVRFNDIAHILRWQHKIVHKCIYISFNITCFKTHFYKWSFSIDCFGHEYKDISNLKVETNTLDNAS